MRDCSSPPALPLCPVVELPLGDLGDEVVVRLVEVDVVAGLVEEVTGVVDGGFVEEEVVRGGLVVDVAVDVVEVDGVMLAGAAVVAAVAGTRAAV